MKLISAHTAANPRRVTIYLAEKGIDLDIVELVSPFAEMKTAEFLRKSPGGRIPVLELDDGDCIQESSAIIEYLEELIPEPDMLGATPRERARTRTIVSMAADLFVSMGNYARHTNPTVLPGRGLKLYPQVAELYAPQVERGIEALDILIGERPFFGGDRPMIGDCHVYAVMHACIDKFAYQLPDRFGKVRAWYRRFGERPSARD